MFANIDKIRCLIYEIQEEGMPESWSGHALLNSKGNVESLQRYCVIEAIPCGLCALSAFGSSATGA